MKKICCILITALAVQMAGFAAFPHIYKRVTYPNTYTKSGGESLDPRYEVMYYLDADAYSNGVCTNPYTEEYTGVAQGNLYIKRNNDIKAHVHVKDADGHTWEWDDDTDSYYGSIDEYSYWYNVQANEPGIASTISMNLYW